MFETSPEKNYQLNSMQLVFHKVELKLGEGGLVHFARGNGEHGNDALRIPD